MRPQYDRFTDHQAPALRADDRRFLFNGLETPDPARFVVEMRPDGEDAHLRKGLVTTTNWLADGTFVIDGLLGRHRLAVRSSGNWFTVAATLENGTDIANGPLDFEPGRTYGNVRVWLSDATAEIEGLMPEGWSADSHSMIMVFPEDMSLWQENRRYIQSGHVAPQTRCFSVKRIPPGHMYLVAVYTFVDRQDPRAGSKDVMETSSGLERRASSSEKPGNSMSRCRHCRATADRYSSSVASPSSLDLGFLPFEPAHSAPISRTAPSPPLRLITSGAASARSTGG